MGFICFLQSLTLLLALCTQRQVHASTELRALMEIKSTLDPTNKVLTSWSSEGDPCSGLFDGVACNEHRKVANISLQEKGLSGKLSPALAELKCLSGLYLHYNSISGEVPKEIGNLSELSDLYLNFNNLSGGVPVEIGGMTSLQVLDLCCNQLTGSIPKQIGSLKKLSVLLLQSNRLTSQIPASLGNLVMLRRLDVRNNSLSGVIPSGLKRLGEGFRFQNNQGLCGVGFPTARPCTSLDNMNINEDASDPTAKTIPETAIVPPQCNQTTCPSSSKLPKVAIVMGVVTGTVTLMIVCLLIVFRHRRQKQKIGDTTIESSDGRQSIDQTKEFSRGGASPLLSLAYSSGWDPVSDTINGIESSDNHLSNFRFNLEEIESATQCFSEANLLGKKSFLSVYKGVLRDGSVVAITSISLTNCKSEDAEFVSGLDLLTSLRHDNLVRMRGFCFSRSRGECFLIYDFAPKGSLSKYLDLEDGSHQVLDWPSRVSIICGIAKGIGYLHSNDSNKPVIIHRSISVDKVLLDQQFNPLIADSGLSKILADDIVFSTIKVSAALGYLAPEYVTTGLFSRKSDMFAFGVIILQILTGKQMLSNSMRKAAQACIYEDFIDGNLKGEFSESEAAKLAKIALDCTNEEPEQRPNIEEVIQDLHEPDVGP